MTIETAPNEGALDQVSGEAGGEVARLKAENTKLMQRNAEIEKYAERAVPYVQVAQALQAAPGGQDIIEKLKKGEPLTKAEEKKAEEAAKTAAEEGGKALTKGEAKELFESMIGEATSKFGETVSAERNAEKSIIALEARAEKELEGYEHLKNDPTFKMWRATTIENIKNERLQVPKDEDDVYFFATKVAYNIAHALQGKPVKGKSEQDRVAAVLASGGGKSSSTTTGQAGESGIPKGMEETIEKIRGYGDRTHIAGKSFSNPKR